MRSMFRSVLVVFVAVLALSAVTAASASATVKGEWLLSEKPVTVSTAVTFGLASGKTFTMKDTTAPGGEVVLSCAAVTGKGTIAPEGKGTVTEFKLSKCSRTKGGGCNVETKKAEEEKEWVRTLNLPWKTQFYRSGEFGNAENVLSANGNGSPAWEFECSTLLGTQKDQCYTAGETANMFHGGEFGREAEEELSIYPFPVLDCKASILNTELRKAAGDVKANLIIKGPEGKKVSFK